VAILRTILIEDYGLPRSGPVSLAVAIPERGVQNVWTTSTKTEALRFTMVS